MINWFKNNRDAVIRNSFLLPILLVVIMSISHVVSWYDLGNPISWAIYLSVAIEIFALASVSAASIKMKRGSIWFLFGLVTLIQIIGNIFYEFKDINPTGESFIAWMELIQPLFVDWEVLDHRRFLATIQGGTLPLMSLTALHFYIKFNDLKDKTKDPKEVADEYFEARNRKLNEITDDNIIKRADKIRMDKVMAKATEMGEKRKASMTEEEYKEMIKDEPTALAFTQYHIDDDSDELQELDELEEIKELDRAAEIDAKIDEELKRASSEPDLIKPEDVHTRAEINKNKDSRESTPIYSKEIDTKTGKFTHKIIRPHGDT